MLIMTGLRLLKALNFKDNEKKPGRRIKILSDKMMIILKNYEVNVSHYIISFLCVSLAKINRADA